MALFHRPYSTLLSSTRLFATQPCSTCLALCCFSTSPSSKIWRASGIGPKCPTDVYKQKKGLLNPTYAMLPCLPLLPHLCFYQHPLSLCLIKCTLKMWFIKPGVDTAVYQDIEGHAMRPSAYKLYWHSNYLSWKDLATVYYSKTISVQLSGIIVPNWPTDSSADMEHCWEDNEKQESQHCT